MSRLLKPFTRSMAPQLLVGNGLGSGGIPPGPILLGPQKQSQCQPAEEPLGLATDRHQWQHHPIRHRRARGRAGQYRRLLHRHAEQRPVRTQDRHRLARGFHLAGGSKRGHWPAGSVRANRTTGTDRSDRPAWTTRTDRQDRPARSTGSRRIEGTRGACRSSRPYRSSRPTRRDGAKRRYRSARSDWGYGSQG